MNFKTIKSHNTFDILKQKSILLEEVPRNTVEPIHNISVQVGNSMVLSEYFS